MDFYHLGYYLVVGYIINMTSVNIGDWFSCRCMDKFSKDVKKLDNANKVITVNLNGTRKSEKHRIVHGYYYGSVVTRRLRTFVTWVSNCVIWYIFLEITGVI